MSTAAVETFQPARWGPERRLEFIDFRLLWDGTINRRELIEFFGISAQQASSDLARYAQQAPENLLYDKKAKTYRASSMFKSLLAHSDAQHYLNQLEALTTGAVPGSSLFVGWRPSCDVIRYPLRPVDTGTLMRLLWAIRDGEDLLVLYQSMRRPAATLRWIAPHALGSDSLRWHVRAWCHERREFRDFVLSRIQRVESTRPSTIDPAQDANWHSRIDVVIRPRSELSVDQQRAIEADYGMKGGRLSLNCRKALAFYVIRQLQLDRTPAPPAPEQPLELENRAKLTALLAVGRKSPEKDSQTN
ncbi:MAG TPA: WYL domain-containing protein [Methylocella sp.]|nr:WYL domain-containing protein [Methylocella sp.]